MSDAFRQSLLNRLPAMPPTRAPWADPPPGDEEEELEEEGLNGLGDLGEGLPSTSSRVRNHDLSPISASGYFSQALEVEPEGSDTTFRVYLTSPSPSRSSAGSSSSSTSRSNDGTLLVCHHGAGASGLSFAMLAKEVKDKDAELGVLAYDARGHGKSRTTPPEQEHDLSLANLQRDLIGVIQHLFPDSQAAPALLLLGHSMGAAPILKAAPILQDKGYKVPGVIVLDVVEGTAIESLPLMPAILAKRPRSFKSVVDGIHWHIASASIRNETSARISVPSYLTPSPDVTDPGPQGTQIWRADLGATQNYWMEWWEGLSQRFLQAKSARLLVLAGKERLDKDLMVGQMQGKFQLEVMQDVGHYLHEDDAATLAQTIITFWRRNTRVMVLPPKIGQGWADQTRQPVEVKPVGDQ